MTHSTIDCTNCGATINPGQNRCHICGLLMAHQKTQRVCINCGSPASQDATTCFMCGHTIDALPNRATDFSVSWPGIIIGLVIIMSLAYWFFQIQPISVSSAPLTETATRFFIPPTETHTATATPTSPPTPTSTATPTPTLEPLIHSVKTGESLHVIAQKYQVSVEDIMRANQVSESIILQIGQKLVIPFPSNSNGASNNPLAGPIIRYTIKEGDTLTGIAFEYDTTVAGIALANPSISLDLLSVGQEIIVPLKPPTETPTPTVTPTPTFTPLPPYQAPHLLFPLDNAIIEGDTITPLLSWTSSGYLDEDIFYVIYLADEKGNLSTYWTNQTSSYHLPIEDRPRDLSTYSWYVVIMEKIGIDENGIFYGKALSNPSATRTFQWR